jgi:penicillin-binding protein 1C
VSLRKIPVPAALLILAAILASTYIPVPRSTLAPGALVSLRLLDRNGIVLREVLSDRGGRCRWLEWEDISPHVIKAVVAVEDRFFFYHPGINAGSLLSASWRNLSRRRVASGASTITMQLARNLYGLPRTFGSKLFEAWMALRLERSLNKEEILLQYLNRICYGNMTYGIEAAARLYFDKPAAHLTLAEAALLSGIPRSPESDNPFRSLSRARRRQRFILKRLDTLGWISHEERRRASAEPLLLASPDSNFRAPHFCDYVLSRLSPQDRAEPADLRTTLDYPLQRKLEILVDNHLRSLESLHVGNAAAVVLDNRCSDILAMVGSRDFFDSRRDGQVNGVLSLRQPGSTLKPFTYGLALEQGVTAASLLQDERVQFSTGGGFYRPQNYDKNYRGPVSLRTALACSYNVPAVTLLQDLGPERLYRKLKDAGFLSLSQGPGFYGVGLTLGNGEVTLLELTQAYAALARGGILLPARALLRPDRKTPRLAGRVFHAPVAYILTDILCDGDARIPAFGYRSPLALPFPCAVKTGTSQDFRDNWAVGYTPDFTVGVWVGNFDGSPMHNVSGISGCGPLFRDIMLHLSRKRPARNFEEPDGLVRVRICPLSGKRTAPGCPGSIEEIFLGGTEPEELCDQSHADFPPPAPTGNQGRSPRLRVAFPMDGDIFKFDPILRPEYQTLTMHAEFSGRIGDAVVTWRLNGEKIGEGPGLLSLSWKLRPGTYTLHAEMEKTRTSAAGSSVRFTVLD